MKKGIVRFIIVFFFCQSFIQPVDSFGKDPSADLTLTEIPSLKDAQEFQVSPSISYYYSRPKGFQWLKHIPSDFSQFAKRTVQKKNTWNIVAVAASTGIMVVYDQEMLDGVQHFSDQINFSGENKQVKLANWSIKIGKNSLPLPIYAPGNLNTGMYFLGDGLTHFTVILGFWGYGLAKKDYRSLQTATQLAECLFATGIATQTLKHLTGRESPFVSTEKGGKWRFFPNQSEYSKHVPHYDAFPSGHLATLVGTVTIIADNYPEYKAIRPIGYGLCGLLSYAMVNNGVHWVADYPLGIAIGYTFAKLISAQGKTVMEKPGHDHPTSWLQKSKPDFILPFTSHGASGLRLFWGF